MMRDLRQEKDRLVASCRSKARWLFGYEGIPLLARPTFRYDLLATAFTAAGTGALYPSLTSQFARRGLEGSTWLVGLLFMLLPMGNFLSTFLARQIAMRRRVPVVVAAWLVMAGFLAVIALLPREPESAWWFAALLVPPSLLLSVVINGQNSIRHSNYPAEGRGRTFARISIVKMGVLAISAIASGYLLDELPWGHRLIYGFAAAMMILGAILFSRIRVRRERSLLQNGRNRATKLMAGFRLLLEDRIYGQFMFWQALFGFANLMCMPLLALIMTDYLKVSYLMGITALLAIPTGTAVFTSVLAGKLFDRIRITRYRAITCTFWASSIAMFYLGVLLNSWAIVIVGSILRGVGIGLGNIAFNLAHTHFSSADRSQDYMGIHLTLIGIRGMAAPLLTAALLRWTYVGLGIMPVAVAVTFFATWGFYRMPSPASAKEAARLGALRNPPRGL